MKKSKNKNVRMTVELGTKDWERLKRLSGTMETSYADILRRATLIYDFLCKRIQSGSKIIIKEGDTEEEVVFVEIDLTPGVVADEKNADSQAG